MPDFSQTSTKLLAVLILAVVVLIPGRFALSAYQSTQAEVAALETEAATLDAQAAEAEAVAADPERYAAQSAALDAAIPADPAITGVIDQLANAAAGSGVNLTNGTPAPGAAAGQYSITLNVSGETQNISAFLSAVRALPRLVTVNQISVDVEATTVQAVFYSQ